MDKATKSLAQRVAALEKFVHTLRDAPRKQDPETVTNAYDPNQEHGGVPGAASGLGDSKPAPTHEPSPKKKWYGSFKRWKSAIQVSGIIAGIAYAVVTWLQWRDLRDNFRLDQQAWIAIKTVTLKRNPTHVEIVIQNVGKTPAAHAKMRISALVTHSTVSSRSDSDSGFDLTLAPQQGHVGDIYLWIPEYSGPGSKEEAAYVVIASGMDTLKVTAAITYFDLFGSPHSTGYCGQYNMVMSAFSDCPEGGRFMK